MAIDDILNSRENKKFMATLAQMAQNRPSLDITREIQFPKNAPVRVTNPVREVRVSNIKDVLQSMTLLGAGVSEIRDAIKGQNATSELASALNPTLKAISTAISKLEKNLPKFSSLDEGLNNKQVLNALEKLDKHLSKLSDTMGSHKGEKPSGDLLDAVERVEEAINGLVFPVAGSKAAYQNSSGEDTSVRLSASGEVPVTFSGGITVDSEFPDAAAITDNFANPTTTSVMSMLMGWDGSTWDRMPGDSTNGLTVNLGTNNDVAASQSGTWNITNISGTVSLPTGAATAANQSTIIGHVDGIEGLLGTIDTDTGNIAAGFSTEGSALGSGVLLQGDDGTDRKNINVDATTGDVQVDVTNTVTVGSHDVTNAGTFAVQEDGAALTALQLIDDIVHTEDTAHSTGHKGAFVLTVRNDSDTALAGTTGDYAPLQTDDLGKLKVIQEGLYDDDSAFGVGTDSVAAFGAMFDDAATDSVDEGDIGIVRMSADRRMLVDADIVSSTTLTVDLGANNDVTIDGSSVVRAEDAVHNTGDTGIMALAVRNDGGTALAADGDYHPLTVDDTGALSVVIGDTLADDSAFGVASDFVFPTGYLADDTLSDSVDEGDIGAPRMTLTRKPYAVISDPTSENNAGVDGSGHLQVDIAADSVGIGGGTQYTAGTDTYAEATTVVTAAGAVRNDTLATLVNTDNEIAPLQVNDLGALWVHDEAFLTDDTAFTVADDFVMPMGALADETTPDSVDEGDIGALRMTLNRLLKVQLADAETPNGDSMIDDTNDALQVNVVAGSTSGTEYDEDVATPATISGPTMMMERDDALSAVTPIEGDWIAARGTAEGALWVQDFNSDAILADTASMDTNLATVAGAVTGTEMQVDIVDDPNALSEDEAHLTGDPGYQMLAVRKATPANLSGTDGDYEPLQVSGGRLWSSATIDAALPAGDNNIGNVDIASSIALDVSAATVTVDNAGTFAVQISDTSFAVADGNALGEGVLIQGDDGTDRKNINVDATTGDVQVDVTNTVTVDATSSGDVPITLAGEAVVLGAGSAAIGKLAANSGVDIGDVDVLSTPIDGAVYVDDADWTADTSEHMLVGAVTQATPTANTDGDTTPLVTNSLRELRTAALESDLAAAGTTHVHKYYTGATPTDGIIWSPAAGKRWYLTHLSINVSAASTVTIEDDKTGGDDPVYKAEFAANSGVVLTFPDVPLFSGEDAADLTVTASAGTVYVTAVGYEI